MSAQEKQTTEVVGAELVKVNPLLPGLLPDCAVTEAPCGRTPVWMLTVCPASWSEHWRVKLIGTFTKAVKAVWSAGVGAVQTGGLLVC